MAEYVLPKFKIEIDSPAKFMPEDGKAHVVVRAKYTHGMSLKGTLAVEVHEPFRSGALAKKTVAIDGEQTIEFDIKKDLKFCQSNSEARYHVIANVTENLTGLSQSCTMDIEVESTYVVRTNPDVNVKFEQGSTATMNVRRLIDKTYFHKQGFYNKNRIFHFRYPCERIAVWCPVLLIQANGT